MIAPAVAHAIGVFLAKGMPLLVFLCLLYSLVRSRNPRR